MNRKILAVLLIAVSLILIFGGCSADKQPKTSTTVSIIGYTNEAVTAEGAEQLETTVNASDLNSEEETTVDASSAKPGEVTTSEVPDIAEDNEQELPNLSEEPAYGFVWALDEEAIRNAGSDFETLEYITYNGDPITIFCQLSNVSLKPWEFGLFIEIEGILQELTVDNTKAEIYHIELQSLETRTVKISFEPNIGKKDEIKNLSCAIMLSPGFVAEEEGEYRMYHDPVASGNYPLVMNADAPERANVTDNTSLYTVSKIDRTIYSNYEESNNLEYFESYPCCYVYEKLRDYLKRDGGAYIRSTRITTKASQNSQLTVNIHGKPGTYRVSFYLNGERLNIFDGKGYIDVTIGKRQQAEIPVIIDTKNLKGANRIEVYYKEIESNFVEGDVIVSSGVQKYIVK